MQALWLEDQVVSNQEVRVGSFLEGLYWHVRPRLSIDVCNALVDDTFDILKEAGHGPLHRITHAQLAHAIFGSTRDWECIGEHETIELVREQRDYTRTVVGDALFQEHYAGMATLDSRSWFETLSC
ncbi:MAG TPA: hypothetical protein VGO93_27030 [Candidatus Xenobia bacterium]|jgi:hypothetical protein